MIPKNIQPFLETRKTTAKDDSLVEGVLTCCGSHDFEVFAAGEVRRNLFSKMHLWSETGEIVLKARCKKCGNVISVFDSHCDGYEQCAKNTHDTHRDAAARPIVCRKCQSSTFSVRVKYEYPDILELEELEIAEIDNAFTWIGITLECSGCGTIHKNFLDYETA